MTKISRILTGAAAVAMLGAAAVPMATFAAIVTPDQTEPENIGKPVSAVSTIVEVTVDQECLIGDGLGTLNANPGTYTHYNGSTTYNNNPNHATAPTPLGVDKLSVTLSATTPYAETDVTKGTQGQYIGTVCNAPSGYKLTEKVDHTDLKLNGSGATGFNAGPGTPTLAGFAANTWSIKYNDVTGAAGVVAAAAKTYDRAPTTTGTVIASTSLPSTLNTISQQFGAKTDGSVAQGAYSAVVTYTIAAN